MLFLLHLSLSYSSCSLSLDVLFSFSIFFYHLPFWISCTLPFFFHAFPPQTPSPPHPQHSYMSLFPPFQPIPPFPLGLFMGNSAVVTIFNNGYQEDESKSFFFPCLKAIHLYIWTVDDYIVDLRPALPLFSICFSLIQSP